MFVSAGANDPGCYAPTLVSKRPWMSFQEWREDGYRWITTLEQPFGLCEFGHQGLPHEEEIDNGNRIQNRHRVLHAGLGRFIQRDPYQQNQIIPTAGDGYQDGMSLYGCYRNNPIAMFDTLGGFSGMSRMMNNSRTIPQELWRQQMRQPPTLPAAGPSSQGLTGQGISHCSGLKRLCLKDGKSMGHCDHNYYECLRNPPQRQDSICSAQAKNLNVSPCAKQCCTEHDNCYMRYGCTANSWSDLFYNRFNTSRPNSPYESQCCNWSVIGCLTKCGANNAAAIGVFPPITIIDFVINRPL